MFETSITIVGNVSTDPVLRRVGEQSVYRFRVASNSRRKTAEGIWEERDTLYASVSCWGKLATGIGGSLAKGDPVIVVGDVYTTEYEDRDGNPRNSVEVRAAAVGLNFAHGTLRVERMRRHDAVAEAAKESIDSERVDSGEADSPDADLPLTA